MKIFLKYGWQPVEHEPGNLYQFPEPVLGLFRAKWQGPAVYRWVIYLEQPGDLKQLYIGEAHSLSRRMRNYLRPGPSQMTSRRMHSLFDAEIAQGRHVTLEYLSYEPFDLNGIPITESDLGDQMVRRFLEHLFIAYFARTGYRVLNRNATVKPADESDKDAVIRSMPVMQVALDDVRERRE